MNDPMKEIIDFNDGKHWTQRTCGECGYWTGKGKYLKAGGCRKYPTTRKNDPACPDFNFQIKRRIPDDTE